MKVYNIIVVGAGVIGMSYAYHLQKNNPDKKILVIDKETGAARGNTAKAAGMFRNPFSSITGQVLSETSKVLIISRGELPEKMCTDLGFPVFYFDGRGMLIRILAFYKSLASSLLLSY